MPFGAFLECKMKLTYYMHPNCSPVPFAVIVWHVETFVLPQDLLKRLNQLILDSCLVPLFLQPLNCWKCLYAKSSFRAGRENTWTVPMWNSSTVESVREKGNVWGREAEEGGKDHQCSSRTSSFLLCPLHPRRVILQRSAFCLRQVTCHPVHARLSTSPFFFYLLSVLCTFKWFFSPSSHWEKKPFGSLSQNMSGRKDSAIWAARLDGYSLNPWTCDFPAKVSSLPPCSYLTRFPWILESDALNLSHRPY